MEDEKSRENIKSCRKTNRSVHLQCPVIRAFNRYRNAKNGRRDWLQRAFHLVERKLESKSCEMQTMRTRFDTTFPMFR